MASNVRITKQFAQVVHTKQPGAVGTWALVRATKEAVQLLRTNTSAEVRMTKIAVQVLRLETGPAHTTGGMQKVGGLAF